MQQTPAPTRGDAEFQGELWSARAQRWAEQETQQRPIYREVAERLGIRDDNRVLEVGCGSGVFLQVAAEQGATVTGLDAAEGLVEIARTRVPSAEVHVGDLGELPFPDETFDVVAGFNAFQFADDMVAALREARRVLSPGGQVAIQVWGRPERCDLTAMLSVVGPLLPSPPPSGPDGRNLCEPGVLEGLASSADLAPGFSGDVVCDFTYPDEETMVDTMLSAGLVVLAARIAGEDTVRTAIREALAPYRISAGAYRFVNEWHYLIASRAR